MKWAMGLLLVAVLTAANTVVAQDQSEQWLDVSNISLGLGVFASGEIYIDQGADVTPLPYATNTPRHYNAQKRVFLRDGYLGFRPLKRPYGHFDFAIVGTVTGFTLDRQTAGPLAGVGSRRLTAELGLMAGLVFNEQTRFDVAATHDIFGEYESYRVRGVLSYTFRENEWELIPNVGFIHRTSKFNNHYVGVSANEAAPGRPIYQPGSSTSPYISLIYSRNLGERWGMDINMNYEFLPSEIEDSPITDADSWPGIFIGFNYRFGG
ncbi:MAG: hypothetical protein DHS20C11_29360 [Lysobacteraceae bacterium]|nr:MAG: hypothetical protein DHS20C11_29360 [Xanthomonadaceae bacterium]